MLSAWCRFINQNIDNALVSCFITNGNIKLNPVRNIKLILVINIKLIWVGNIKLVFVGDIKLILVILLVVTVNHPLNFYWQYKFNVKNSYYVALFLCISRFLVYLFGKANLK